MPEKRPTTINYINTKRKKLKKTQTCKKYTIQTAWEFSSLAPCFQFQKTLNFNLEETQFNHFTDGHNKTWWIIHKVTIFQFISDFEFETSSIHIQMMHVEINANPNDAYWNRGVLELNMSWPHQYILMESMKMDLKSLRTLLTSRYLQVQGRQLFEVNIEFELKPLLRTTIKVDCRGAWRSADIRKCPT